MLAILFGVSLAGCLDTVQHFVEGIGGPRYDQILMTPLDTEGWNTRGTVVVQVVYAEPVQIRMAASQLDGVASVSAEGVDEATLELPDGVWRVEVTLDGRLWRAFEPVRVDSTPPEPVGLVRTHDAPSGQVTLSAVLPPDTESVRIEDAATGAVVAQQLPHTLRGLPDGLHVFRVVVVDRAGLEYHATVQVWVGSALDLPDGRFSMGIVARYRNEVRLWDISDLSRYVDRSVAAAAAPDYLQASLSVTPDDPQVKRVANEVVSAGMTTGEAAFALFRWMVDELEYDEARLSESNLLTPRQTMEAGGGVCRDLAALYASLLRAAGVPARIVSGYIAGEVQGFHAWVEFYAGPIAAQSAWMPVDVSGIGLSSDPSDDAYSVDRALNAFGIQPADYLLLRRLPVSAEDSGWSTAISVNYTYQPGTDPVRLDRHVTDRVDGVPTDVNGKLCVNRQTLARQAITAGSDCSAAFSHVVPSFLLRTRRTIDYGVAVTNPGAGTEVTVVLSYPFEQHVQPNEVVYRFYGAQGNTAFSVDSASGKAQATRRY